MSEEFSDEEIIEIWESSYVFEWEDQLERYGYVVFNEEEDYETPAAWMAKLVEWRWTPPEFTNWLPSRMWDTATPSQGGLQLTTVGQAWLKKDFEAMQTEDQYNPNEIDAGDEWDDLFEDEDEDEEIDA